MHNPFENAMLQLEKVAKITNIDPYFLESFKYPNRELRFSIPVKMDDGSTKFFEGYRVEYNNALGPYKGGIRFHPETEINEVKALAFWMAIKCAVANIPMGGGKGGITVEPKSLSEAELERLSRGWVARLSDVLGPHKDVPAPDVNTNPQIMAWMNDEFMKLTGEKSLATFTGKPVDKGGSLGRTQATGLGGFYVFNSLREQLGLPISCKVVIQGFGNVGSNAAEIFMNNGHKVLAVSDSKGGIYNESGLDIKALIDYKKTTGKLAGFEGSTEISNEELLSIDCDVLIPGAFENVITDKNVHNIKTKAVLELANGPTTPEADEILFSKNIPVIPDVLANSGGVTVSYFEWDQNLRDEHWTEEDVNKKLLFLMNDAALAVYNKSKELNTDLRRGSFALALERIKAKS